MVQTLGSARAKSKKNKYQFLDDNTQMYATKYFRDNNYFEMMKHFSKGGKKIPFTRLYHSSEHIFAVIPILIIIIGAVNTFFVPVTW